MDVSVITPTVPGRESLLEEAVASVAAQTTPVLEHLTWVDDGEGPGPTRNRLARMAEGDWLLFLDDDDLLDQDFVEVLAPHTLTGDVVYPWCRVRGELDWSPNRLFDAAGLLQYNFVPVTALVRKSLFERVGGMDAAPWEDWVFWRKCLAAGARFRCVPEVLWTYRIREGTRNEWKAGT